jgi:uncharacterized Zn-finger protein
MKKHKRIHKGEKSYKCNIYDYASKRLGNFKRHERIHTGEKPYKCNICDYACKQLDNFKDMSIYMQDKSLINVIFVVILLNGQLL